MLETDVANEDLAAHLGVRAPTLSTDDDFAAWAWKFHRFGQRVMVQAALVAARIALPVWVRYRPLDEEERGVFAGPLVGSALDAVSRWLESEARPEQEVEQVLGDLKQLVDRVSFYVQEASGSADVVLAREKALSAASAALAVLETFAWTEAQAAPGEDAADEAELEARKRAGPALHVVEALSHACLATGIDAHRLRDELRASLLRPEP